MTSEVPEPAAVEPVVSDAVVSEAVVSDAAVPEALEPTTASGKRGLTIALVIALLAVVALGGLSVYLWAVHSQYVSQNEELRADATSLGGELATSRELADKLQAQLDDTTAQLEATKDTISDLANSEAQAGDDRQALIDIADGLQQCADLRQDLIDHLDEASKWTTASLRANEASTTSFCKKVTAAYKEVIDD